MMGWGKGSGTAVPQTPEGQTASGKALVSGTPEQSHSPPTHCWSRADTMSPLAGAGGEDLLLPEHVSVAEHSPESVPFLG